MIMPSCSHGKTQHALVRLGSTALVAAIALPRKGDPNFPKWIIKCIKIINKNIKTIKKS